MSNNAAIRGRRFGRAVRLLLFGAASLVVGVLCACDVRRGGSDPIDECTSYAASAESCFGTRVASRLRASFARPPIGEAARTTLKAQCVENRAQLRRICR